MANERSEVESLLHREVIDAIAHAVIVTEPEGKILLWSMGAEVLFGWTEAEVLGRSVVEVLSLPEELADSEQQLQQSVLVGERRLDRIVSRRDGTEICVEVVTRPLFDEDGNVACIVGVSEDVQKVRRLELAETDLTERLQLALDAGGLGTWHWNRTTEVVEWDERLEVLFGFEPGTFDGKFSTWQAAIHPDDRAAINAVISEAIAQGHGYTVRHRVLWRDESVHWLAASGQVILDAKGEVIGTIGCVDDITEQVEVDRTRDRLTALAMAAADTERRHRVRLQYLADVNRDLNQSRSRERVLAEVPKTAVPRVAAWSALYVLPGSDPDCAGAPPDVSISTDDPKLVPAVRSLEVDLSIDPALAEIVDRVIRTGKSDLITPATSENLDEVATSNLPTHFEDVVLSPLAFRASMTVPLIKRGRVLGALQLVQYVDGRPYGELDLSMAETAAARIASSLTNLRLIEHERHIAITLQQALLPSDIPEIPGVDVAVRYWASGEGTEVGGDFYDVFAISDEEWAVVVGDVCGKGPEAAAVTSVTRHSIRMSAWHGDQPVEVLTWLNHALLPLDSSRFCTAAYAVIRRGTDAISMTSVAGGHPLPILSHADDSIDVIGEPGTILGAFPSIDVTETTTSLHSGDTVVLYTDGITDIAPPYGFDAEDMAEFVRGCLAEGGTADDMAERMFEAITKRLPIIQRSDDIALLVLRIM